jgi:hypothetical protein
LLFIDSQVTIFNGSSCKHLWTGSLVLLAPQHFGLRVISNDRSLIVEGSATAFSSGGCQCSLRALSLPQQDSVLGLQRVFEGCLRTTAENPRSKWPSGLSPLTLSPHGECLVLCDSFRTTDSLGFWDGKTGDGVTQPHALFPQMKRHGWGHSDIAVGGIRQEDDSPLEERSQLSPCEFLSRSRSSDILTQSTPSSIALQWTPPTFIQ